MKRPFFCKCLNPLETKLLKVRIKHKNVTITFVAIGFSVYLFRTSLTDLIPLLLGVFVERDLTSMVTNIKAFACPF